jgi:transposase InsO family protein
VDLRNEFMQRVLRGERVTDLCREYGISRKTGDKFKQRFMRMGVAGLADQSRAPQVIPHRTPPEVVEILLGERKHHPSWGPKKLKDVLEKRLGRSFPAASTIGDVLSKHGLVKARRHRPRQRAKPTALRVATAANDLWCIDYKGQFRLGDRSYCYPLTITDQFSRYILCCEGMSAICEEAARDACEETFRAHGLPTAMRSDNGAPFASTGLAGLSKLSVYWMRLGLICERIRPAHPEDNGRHERMHRTLKFETARPARTNLLQQQECFDDFVEEFNRERPHEGLDMKRPAELYVPSARPYPSSLPEPTYPAHDDVLGVNRFGDIQLCGRSRYISTALVGQKVGVREQREGGWLVTFIDLDLGILPTKGPLLPVPTSIPPDVT